MFVEISFSCHFLFSPWSVSMKRKQIKTESKVVFQPLSCVWLFVAPGTAALQASLSFSISRSLLKLMSIESVMPSNHLTLCCPLLLLPSIFPSIRVFPNELALGIWVPGYWSLSISPSNEYSGLISFRIDWLDLLAVQGILKKAKYLMPTKDHCVQQSHPD